MEALLCQTSVRGALCISNFVYQILLVSFGQSHNTGLTMRYSPCQKVMGCGFHKKSCMFTYTRMDWKSITIVCAEAAKILFSWHHMFFKLVPTVQEK